MIERDQLTEGTFVWWRADRMFKSWDVPCKIVKAPYKIDPDENWERFTVLSLDDMKETELGYGGEAHKYEIRPTTLGKVKSYLTDRKLKLKQNVIDAVANVAKAELAVETAKEAVTEYEQIMAEILKDMS